MTSIPQITDSHCHLDFPDFDEDRDDIIARAHVAGVTRMVTICTKLRNEPQVRAIAEKYPSVFYAAATHPMSVAAEPAVTVDDLVALAAHPKFVAIGETGLDYHYTIDSAQAQKDALRIHIEAVRRTNLPLIIHSRAADKDMADILASEMKNGAFTCVMHCFSSTPELARATLDLGFYLSMSGIATFPKSAEVRDIFAAAPVDRLFTKVAAYKAAQ
jgi:TatD DNase family protein